MLFDLIRRYFGLLFGKVPNEKGEDYQQRRKLFGEHVPQEGVDYQAISDLSKARFDDTVEAFRMIDGKAEKIIAVTISLFAVIAWLSAEHSFSFTRVFLLTLPLLVSIWHSSRCRLPRQRRTLTMGCESLHLVEITHGQAEYWSAFAYDKASALLVVPIMWKSRQVRCGFTWLVIGAATISIQSAFNHNEYHHRSRVDRRSQQQIPLERHQPSLLPGSDVATPVVAPLP